MSQKSRSSNQYRDPSDGGISGSGEYWNGGTRQHPSKRFKQSGTLSSGSGRNYTYTITDSSPALGGHSPMLD